ncbi:hypothetical protein Pmani_034787 [Petrolisthes manimaculis]|uniref:Uncharacterized protein n=1 Tax=Petrolisthes manimaculis TaxID=1843537 RepID=A0AAE1NNM1_9EUCA|nr:hypothetical protein Pmani_034787 [Petrolisthes manimaculis]
MRLDECIYESLPSLARRGEDGLTRRYTRGLIDLCFLAHVCVLSSIPPRNVTILLVVNTWPRERYFRGP